MCDWMAYSAGLLAKELAMSISFSPIGSQSLNGMCVCVYGMNLKYALCWHIHISVHSYYASVIHKHTHILKPFEDSEPTGLKVDIAHLSPFPQGGLVLHLGLTSLRP